MAAFLLFLLPLAATAETPAPVECVVCPGDAEVFYSVTHFLPISVNLDMTKYSLTGTNGKIFEAGLYSGTLVSQAVYDSGIRIGTNYFYRMGIKGLKAGKATLALLYDGQVVVSYNITIGHDWDNATYVWSEDYSTVTATRHCGRNHEHDATETVQTTSKITVAATEKKEGKKVYTAVFTNDAFTTQTKEIKIPKLASGSGGSSDSDGKVKTTLKKISITKLKADSKSKITVTWKKLTGTDRKKISKIEIQVSTDKNFKKIIADKTVSSGKTSITIKGLKKSTKYYVRIRAYTKSGKILYVSKWSSKKNIKTKK